MTQSIGYGFAGGALLFSALGSVLTKKISTNFDKKVISSAIGLSILIIAFCTPIMDDAMAPFMPMFTKDLEDVTARLGNDSSLLPYLTPRTNLTCFADAALNQTTAASSAELDEEALAAIASDCALPTVPYVPRDIDDAFIVFVIAVLGCGQQYCLIAALKVRILSRIIQPRIDYDGPNTDFPCD